MYITGMLIDLGLVIEQAVKREVFASRYEAQSFLSELCTLAVNESEFESYVTLIQEKYMLRELMKVGKDIFELAGKGEYSKEIVDYAAIKIDSVRSRQIKGCIPIKPCMLEVIKELSNKQAAINKTSNASSSPVDKSDKYIFGLNPAELTMLSNRSGAERTNIIASIAIDAAKKNLDKKIVVFNSLIPRAQFVSRLIGEEANISHEKMQGLDIIYQDEWKRICDVAETLCVLELYINDTPNISISEIKTTLRRLKRYNLGLVIIDNPVMTFPKDIKNNESIDGIDTIKSVLTRLAKELDVPIILCTPLL
jgi:replicative DNA helicase